MQDLQVERESKLRADDERLKAELDEMETAFYEAFKTEEERTQMISDYSKGTTTKLPVLVKSIAITKWWSDQ